MQIKFPLLRRLGPLPARARADGRYLVTAGRDVVSLSTAPPAGRERAPAAAHCRNRLPSQRAAAPIVTRDQTRRDRADLQQPFNLQMAGDVRVAAIALPEAACATSPLTRARRSPPARRALDPAEHRPRRHADVRQRNRISLQAGDMRRRASCHGANRAKQARLAAPSKEAQALRALLQFWKTLPQE